MDDNISTIQHAVQADNPEMLKTLGWKSPWTQNHPELQHHKINDGEFNCAGPENWRDVVQTGSSCFLVGGMASAAKNDKLKGIILSTPEQNRNCGCYEVLLWDKGRPIIQKVDQFFPKRMQSQLTSGDKCLDSYIIERALNEYFTPREPTGSRKMIAGRWNQAWNWITGKPGHTAISSVPLVEKHLDRGDPMTMGVHRRKDGDTHAVALLGQRNGKYQVYEQWGYLPRKYECNGNREHNNWCDRISVEPTGDSTFEVEKSNQSVSVGLSGEWNRFFGSSKDERVVSFHDKGTAYIGLFRKDHIKSETDSLTIELQDPRTREVLETRYRSVPKHKEMEFYPLDKNANDKPVDDVLFHIKNVPENVQYTIYFQPYATPEIQLGQTVQVNSLTPNGHYLEFGKVQAQSGQDWKIEFNDGSTTTFEGDNLLPFNGMVNRT